MDFTNEQHKATFIKESKKMDKQDNTQMAILYLLTAERKLWNATKIYRMDKKIPIHRIKVKRCTEEGYTLFCCAKDLALGTKHVSMNDLADKTLITPKLWKIIYNAMQIKRFGLSAVRA